MTVICSEANRFVLLNLRKQVREILPGAKVFACSSSEQAKKTAKEQGCDILITEIDFGLHKGEGIILATEIKKLNPQVNIIFATAGSENEFAVHMLKMKISGFLVKPFTKEELKEELRNLRYPSEANDAERSIGCNGEIRITNVNHRGGKGLELFVL